MADSPSRFGARKKGVTVQKSPSSLRKKPASSDLSPEAEIEALEREVALAAASAASIGAQVEAEMKRSVDSPGPVPFARNERSPARSSASFLPTHSWVCMYLICSSSLVDCVDYRHRFHPLRCPIPRCFSEFLLLMFLPWALQQLVRNPHEKMYVLASDRFDL